MKGKPALWILIVAKSSNTAYFIHHKKLQISYELLDPSFVRIPAKTKFSSPPRGEWNEWMNE